MHVYSFRVFVDKWFFYEDNVVYFLSWTTSREGIIDGSNRLVTHYSVLTSRNQSLFTQLVLQARRWNGYLCVVIDLMLFWTLR